MTFKRPTRLTGSGKPKPRVGTEAPDLAFQFTPPVGMSLTAVERQQLITAMQGGMSSMGVVGACFGNEERVGVWVSNDPPRSYVPTNWLACLKVLSPLAGPSQFAYSIGFDFLQTIMWSYMYNTFLPQVAGSEGYSLWTAAPTNLITEIDGAYVENDYIELVDIPWQVVITDELIISQQRVDCHTTTQTSEDSLSVINAEVVAALTGAELGLIPGVGKFLGGILPGWALSVGDLGIPSNTPPGVGQVAKRLFPSVIPLSGTSMISLVYNSVEALTGDNSGEWTGQIGAGGTCVVLGLAPALERPPR